MAITNEQQTEILKIVAGLFNAAPGGTNLTELANLVSGGMTTSQLADALAAHSLFTGTIMAGKVTTSAQVAVLMNNFGLTADSDPASAGSQAQAYFTQQINSGVGFGKIVFDTVTYLSGSPAPEFITVATLLSNKALVAAAYSESNSSTSLTTLQNILANVTGTAAYTDQDIQDILDAASGTNVGQTFTLTTGSDNFTGTSSDDTFDGAFNSNGSQTYQVNDKIDGGAGNDIALIKVAAGTYVPSVLKNVEAVSVEGTGAVIFNVTNATGITKLTNAASSSTVEFRNVDVATAIQINNTASANTVTYKSNTLSGDTDNASISVDGLTGTLTIADVDASTSDTYASETITLNSSGTASTIGTLTTTNLGATKLVVTGDQNLTITANTDATTGGVTLKTIDASAFTGSLSITGAHNTASQAGNTVTGGTGNDTLGGGAGNDIISGGTGNDSITAGDGIDSLSGGANNDTFVMAGNLTSDDTVDGGDGTDVLTTTAAITGTAGKNVSSIETVVASATGIEISAAAVSGVSTLRYDVDGAGTVTFSNLAGTETIDLRTATGSNDSVTATKAVDGTADSQTVTIGNSTGSTAVALGTLTLNDAETINITSSLVANSINSLVSSDATKLNVTATSGLTVTAFTATALKTIDASASTAAFIMGAAIGSSSVTLTGGSANDTLIGSAGNDSVVGGAGDDGIQLGGAGGNDNWSGGDGNDTFISVNAITSDITANDSLSGGAGTDTLQFGSDTSGVAAIDLTGSGILANVTGVEKIVLADTDTAQTLTIDDNIVGIAGGTLTVTTATGVGVASTVVNNTLSSTSKVVTTQAVAQTLNYTLGNSIDDVTGGTAADAFTLATSAYLGTSDSIRGGAGSDTLTFSGAAEGTFTAAQLAGISSVETFTVNTTAGTEAYKFTLSDTVAGNNFSGTSFAVSRAAEAGTLEVQGGSVTYALSLTGGSAADTLVGGTGNDSVSGALGADSLTGGTGNDTFTVSNDTSADTITDFNFGTSSTGVDKIDIAANYLGGADGAQAAAALDTAPETVTAVTGTTYAGVILAATDVAVFTGATYASAAGLDTAIEALDSAVIVQDFFAIYQDTFGSVRVAIVESDGSADSGSDFTVTDAYVLTGITITGVSSLIDTSDFSVV